MRLASQLTSPKGLRRLKNSAVNAWNLRQTLSAPGNFEDVAKFVLDHVAPVQEPLVLISQAERSGGSLLSQLFDGHPQIFAHPHEIKLGYPDEHSWPPLDPALGARKNFLMLFEDKTVLRMRAGYTKGAHDPARHPYFLLPGLQYRIFERLFTAVPPKSARDILNHFFASYFNAWLNYHGGLSGKRWVTAFAPRVANYENNVAGFFEDYPDGRLIQIVREPTSWYASARIHRGEKSSRLTLEKVMNKWLVSASAMLRNRASHPDSVIIVRFADLIQHTEPLMRALAGLFGIAFEPVLLEPTHNGYAIRANSSFAVEGPGVIDAPVLRPTDLNDDERAYIDRYAAPVYDQVCRIALTI